MGFAPEWQPGLQAARRHKSIQPEKERWSSERTALGTIHAAGHSKYKKSGMSPPRMLRMVLGSEDFEDFTTPG